MRALGIWSARSAVQATTGPPGRAGGHDHARGGCGRNWHRRLSAQQNLSQRRRLDREHQLNNFLQPPGIVREQRRAEPFHQFKRVFRSWQRHQNRPAPASVAPVALDFSKESHPGRPSRRPPARAARRFDPRASVPGKGRFAGNAALQLGPFAQRNPMVQSRKVSCQNATVTPARFSRKLSARNSSSMVSESSSSAGKPRAPARGSAVRRDCAAV